jgi:hypothetical protein
MAADKFERRSSSDFAYATHSVAVHFAGAAAPATRQRHECWPDEESDRMIPESFEPDTTVSAASPAEAAVFFQFILSPAQRTSYQAQRARKHHNHRGPLSEIPNSTCKRIHGSSCAITGCRTVCSNSTGTSSAIAANPREISAMILGVHVDRLSRSGVRVLVGYFWQRPLSLSHCTLIA